MKIHHIREEKHYTVETNSKGVRTFALNRNNALLCIVDLDGLVTIQLLATSTGVHGRAYSSSDAVKRVPGLVPRNLVRDDGNKVQVSWSPHGHLVAVPGGKCIHFLVAAGPESPAEGSWIDTFLTADPGLDESHDADADISMVAFSPDGDYLASADRSGAVVLWKMEKELENSKPVRKFRCTPSAPLRGLGWGLNEGDNYLAVMTHNSWAQIGDVVPPPVKAVATVEVDAVAPATNAASLMDIIADDGAALDKGVDADAGAIMSEQATGIIEPEKVKGTGGRLKRNEAAEVNNADNDDDDGLFDDELDMLRTVASEEETNVSSIKKKVLNIDDDNNYKEDDVDDAEDAGLDEAPVHGLTEEAVLRLVQEGRATLPTHPPFQPGSTRRDEKGRRYLVWNSIGNITSREENDSNRIEIRFANTMSQNKQEGFPDTDGYTMASLAYEGAVFASEPEVVDQDDPTPPRGSVVHYHAFHGFLGGANESFTYPLPSGEAALAVAVGTGWCAIATSKGFLRIFSSTGIQISVTCLTGPVVCLCGYGTQLAVVFAIESTSCLSLELLAITPFSPGCSRSVLEMALPLTAKSTLTWVGFDVDTQILSTIDSAGMMRMLMRPFGWKWVPVLDIARAKKAPEHVYWPIMVKGSKLVYVLLNGESRPAIYPQPVTTVKALRVPIIEIKDGRDKGEAVNEKAHLHVLETARASHWESMKVEGTVFGFMLLDSTPEAFEKRFKDQENEADKTAVWLLQKACILNRIPQALDLAHKLRTELGLKTAMIVANKMGRQQVAQKLQDLLDTRFASMVEEEEPESSYHLKHQYQHEGHHAEGGYNGHYGVDYSSSDIVGGQEENNDNNMDRLSRKQVTPNVAPSAATAESSRVAVNPFMKSQSSPSGKRKTGYDIKDLKNLKGSPSPSKKPMLSVSIRLTPLPLPF